MGSGASKSGPYKLTYFNVRGRAEVARLCFAASGVPYEDVRVEQSDWPKVKPTMPLGFMPLLEVNGMKLSQSMAVTRFVAKRCGLYGSNDLEQAKIDEVVDTVTELAVTANGSFFQDDAAKAATAKSMKESKVPFIFSYLEKTIKENPSGSGFLVGGKLSVADIAVFSMLEAVGSLVPNVADKYDKIKQLEAKVRQNSNIAKYLQKRVKTPA